MIFTVLRVAKVVSKVATVALVVKKGYETYKKGAVIYKTYKKVKNVSSGTKGIVKQISKKLKK